MTSTYDITELYNMIQNIIDQEVNGNEVLISTIGSFTSDSITEVLDQVEIATKTLPKKVKKRTFFVTVELLQNIHRYCQIDPREGKNGKFGFYVLSKISNFTTKVLVGNLVTQQQKSFLNNYLNKLRAMNMDQLKEYYYDILENKPHSIQGGGGLGFLEIAKKNKLNFDFKFIKYNLESYLFIYSAIISIENH